MEKTITAADILYRIEISREELEKLEGDKLVIMVTKPQIILSNLKGQAQILEEKVGESGWKESQYKEVEWIKL